MSVQVKDTDARSSVIILAFGVAILALILAWFIREQKDRIMALEARVYKLERLSE